MVYLPMQGKRWERKTGKDATCKRWCVLGRLSCITMISVHKSQHTLQLQGSRVQAVTSAGCSNG